MIKSVQIVDSQFSAIATVIAVSFLRAENWMLFSAFVFFALSLSLRLSLLSVCPFSVAFVSCSFLIHSSPYFLPLSLGLPHIISKPLGVFRIFLRLSLPQCVVSADSFALLLSLVSCPSLPPLLFFRSSLCLALRLFLRFYSLSLSLILSRVLSLSIIPLVSFTRW